MADSNDTITGTSSNEWIFGTDADETIDGAGGIDWIDGSGGNDSIEAGEGSVFSLLMGGSGNDTISAISATTPSPARPPTSTSRADWATTR